MTLREVLQIELWSKQTSRKILRVSRVVIAFVMFVAVTGYIVERRWITSSEKRAARVALAQIEGLQAVSSSTEAEFDKQKERADAAVQETQVAAWTWRNHKVSQSLSGYLVLTVMARDDRQRAPSMREFYSKRPDSEKMQRKSTEMSQQVRDFLDQTLHRALE